MEDVLITRYGIPGKHDLAPQGARCSVITGGGKITAIYAQMSKDEENPRWELVEEPIPPFKSVNTAVDSPESTQEKPLPVKNTGRGKKKKQ